MNRSYTSMGTRQKSYDFPDVKRIRMRCVSGSYPIDETADDETRIISMGVLLGKAVVWKHHYTKGMNPRQFKGSSHE